MSEYPIQIANNKLKVLLLLGGALLLICGSIWLVLNADSIVKQLVGVIGALFFGIALFFITKKVSQTTYGLIINEEGIIDHTTGVSIGLVRWEDIVEIYPIKVSRNNMITVIVKNPEYYINLSKSRISKLALKANHKYYGSPIHINSNTLQRTFAELLIMLTTAFEANRSNPSEMHQSQQLP